MQKHKGPQMALEVELAGVVVVVGFLGPLPSAHFPRHERAPPPSNTSSDTEGDPRERQESSSALIAVEVGFNGHEPAKAAIVQSIQKQLHTVGLWERRSGTLRIKSGLAQAGGLIGNQARSQADGLRATQKRRQDQLSYLDESTCSLACIRQIQAVGRLSASNRPLGAEPATGSEACDQGRNRILVAMDAETDRLFYRQQESFDPEDLQDLYREMVDPRDEEKRSSEDRLWVVQDNAPFHLHLDVPDPDVPGLSEPQVWPRAHPDFEYSRPPTWPDPKEAARSNGGLSAAGFTSGLRLLAESDRAALAVV